MQILNGRRHRVEELVFSHDGRWLAAAGTTGGVHVWDTTKPAERATQVRVNSSLLWVRTRTLAFRRDGKLFCRSWDNWHLIDLETGEASRIAGQKYGQFVLSLDATRIARTFTGSPARAYTIGSDGKVRANHRLSIPLTYFRNAAYSPDGRTLAVEESRRAGATWTSLVRLRNADTGEPSAFSAALGDFAEQLLFSSDGSRLLVRQRNRITLWQVSEPGRSPVRADNPAGTPFISVAFHPDGKLLTVDNDRLVRVWDADTLQPDRAIRWDVGKLYAVALSPDGTRAAVGSHTGKVLVWDWD